MLNRSVREYIVDAKESGQKLLAFISARLRDEGEIRSSRFIKKIIENHSCRINGRPESFATTPVETGDRIQVRVPEVDVCLSGKFDPKRILYEDEFLFVYDKPQGVTCDEKGILSHLKSYRSESILVHRLDRDTTGALIVAKNRSVFDALVDMFKRFSVKKRYLAIVDGIVVKHKGTIENALGKIRPYAGQTIWGSVDKSKGLYACTHWERLKTGISSSLLACYPVTGRTHQIRVHLSEAGHPILGDVQYAKQFKCPYTPSRYLLHAEEISFVHPENGHFLKIPAPLPEDFKDAVRELFTKRNDNP